MGDSALLTLIIILILDVLFAIVFFVFPRIIIPSFEKKKNKKKEIEIVKGFLTKTLEDNPGSEFTKLIEVGFFQSLRTGNHGKDFPDEKQYKGFINFSNSSITNALKEVGEIYEKFII